MVFTVEITLRVGRQVGNRSGRGSEAAGGEFGEQSREQGVDVVHIRFPTPRDCGSG